MSSTYWSFCIGSWLCLLCACNSNTALPEHKVPKLLRTRLHALHHTLDHQLYASIQGLKRDPHFDTTEQQLIYEQLQQLTAIRTYGDTAFEPFYVFLKQALPNYHTTNTRGTASMWDSLYTIPISFPQTQKDHLVQTINHLQQQFHAFQQQLIQHPSPILQGITLPLNWLTLDSSALKNTLNETPTAPIGTLYILVKSLKVDLLTTQLHLIQALERQLYQNRHVMDRPIVTLTPSTLHPTQHQPYHWEIIPRAYSSTLNPEVIVDGQAIPVNRGVATYLAPTDQLGSQTLNIQVTYHSFWSHRIIRDTLVYIYEVQ